MLTATVIAAAACSLTLPNAQNNSTPHPTSPPTTVPVTYQYSVTAPRERHDDVNIKRIYPVSKIVAGPHGLPDQVANKAEAALNGHVESIVKDFEVSGRKSGYDSLFLTGVQWSIDISSHVDIRDDSILTATFFTVAYYGGVASDLPSSVTINMQTGTPVSINDVVTPGKLTAFETILRTQLLTEADSHQLPGYGIPKEQLVSPGQTADLIDEGRWYPNFDGFHVMAPSGLLAPMSVDAIDVVVPWSQLRDLVTPFARTSWHIP